MSSARNHAKRSHRSEQVKKSTVGLTVRRTYVRQAQKPKRVSLFERLFLRGAHSKQKTV